MDDVRTPPAGVIVAFPDPSSRARRPLAVNEPRGQILLFTGVRYERMDDSGPQPAFSDGHSRRRRRRS